MKTFRGIVPPITYPTNPDRPTRVKEIEMNNAEQMMTAVFAALPSTFELTAFAGSKFRVSRTASYVDSEGVARFVVQRETKPNVWEDFSKGSIDELRRELPRGSARKKLEGVAVEYAVHETVEKFAIAIAEKHTVLNLGQPWPEMSYYQLRSECESDELHDATVEEYRSWLSSSRKEAEMVAKAGLPLTLANAEDAFLRRGVFAKTAKATKASKAKRAAKSPLDRLVAKPSKKKAVSK